MPGLWKEGKAKSRLFPSSHEPLGNLIKTPMRFPHSHSSDDEGRWKSGKPNAGFPLFHYPDALPKEKQNNSDLRITYAHDIYRFGNISW